MKAKGIHYDANYPYNHKHIDKGTSKKGYPIVERTDNALIFPECAEDHLSREQFKELS